MTVPALTITEADGRLGVLQTQNGRMLAIMGVSSSGTANVPSAFARSNAVRSAFGYGAMPEAAIYAIEKYGLNVLCIKTGSTTAGSTGTVTSSALGGTSVATATSVTAAYDEYQIRVRIVTGGTIGTAGITLRYSIDAGQNESGEIALGTANNYQIPGTNGCQINFAAGTLVAGATYSWNVTPPSPNTSEQTAALTALSQSAQPWEVLYPAFDLDATAFATIDSAVSAMRGKAWIGGVVKPTAAQTEATYLTAMTTLASSLSSTYGVLCAGGCDVVTGGAKWWRSPAFVVAPRVASLSEEQNPADPNLGALPGVSIRDAYGNPKHHDEMIYPGLDSIGLCALRTWDSFSGTYINRAQLKSSSGSDFTLVGRRRVMNLAKSALYAYLNRRLNNVVRVNSQTGFILEEDAKEIEIGANAALDAVLSDRPKASGWAFVLSRTDNLLSTKTLNGTCKLTPLADIEAINLEISYYNPALQTQVA